MLSVCVANAIAGFVTEVSENQAFVKWPNDVFVQDKKVAGILIENSIKGSQIVSAIVGIGVNVNQSDFEAFANASSLSMIANKQFDLNTLINILSSYLEASYLKLRAGKYQELLTTYNHKLFRKDSWTKFTSQDEVQEFKILNVESDGRLCVLNQSNETLHLDFGYYRMQL